MRVHSWLNDFPVLTPDHLDPSPVQPARDCVCWSSLVRQRDLQPAIESALFGVARVLRYVHVAARQPGRLTDLVQDNTHLPVEAEFISHLRIHPSAVRR